MSGHVSALPHLHTAYAYCKPACPCTCLPAAKYCIQISVMPVTQDSHQAQSQAAVSTLSLLLVVHLSTVVVVYTSCDKPIMRYLSSAAAERPVHLFCAHMGAGHLCGCGHCDWASWGLPAWRAEGLLPTVGAHTCCLPGCPSGRLCDPEPHTAHFLCPCGIWQQVSLSSTVTSSSHVLTPQLRSGSAALLVHCLCCHQQAFALCNLGHDSLHALPACWLAVCVASHVNQFHTMTTASKPCVTCRTAFPPDQPGLKPVSVQAPDVYNRCLTWFALWQAARQRGAVHHPAPSAPHLRKGRGPPARLHSPLGGQPHAEHIRQRDPAAGPAVFGGCGLRRVPQPSDQSLVGIWFRSSVSTLREHDQHRDPGLLAHASGHCLSQLQGDVHGCLPPGSHRGYCCARQGTEVGLAVLGLLAPWCSCLSAVGHGKHSVVWNAWV